MSEPIKLDSNGFDTTILCPHCDDPYTHHGRVDVFNRFGEDSPGGIHTTAYSGGTVVSTDIERNPSSRRDGIEIHFWCESCEARFVLGIVQHKGCTYLSTRPEEPGETLLTDAAEEAWPQRDPTQPRRECQCVGDEDEG